MQPVIGKAFEFTSEFDNKPDRDNPGQKQVFLRVNAALPVVLTPDASCTARIRRRAIEYWVHCRNQSAASRR
jgi:hypothetical protein